MKKIKFFIFIFFVNFTFLFSEDSALKQDLKTKLNQIQKELDELEKKKIELITLKEQFEKSDKIKKPKIALVLSGGGAKGVAHIGVLKVLEKYNIPIDYIVGTSAGSIIGAMYAIGYSPEEIENIVSNLKIDKLFTNNLNRELESILQKTQKVKYPIKIAFDENYNPLLPMGALSGEYIYLELKKIFSKAEGIKKFSEFPIPYKAITTNLQTGETVALEDGDLALATLKSMAIPTFLEPIKVGDNYYVDGGVSDNFPVLQALKMGANIVIGVDISAPPTKITDNTNIIQVLDKLSLYQNEKNFNRQLKYVDFLIRPNVKDYGIFDFSTISKLVDEGEKSATLLKDKLVLLSNKSKFDEIKMKKDRLKNREFDIKKVVAKGNELLTTKIIEDMKPEKTYLSVEDLNLWSEKIYTKSYVNRVFYEVMNENTIKFDIHEKVDKELQLGLFYISNYGAGIEIVAQTPVFNRFNIEKNYLLKTEFSKFPKISITDLAQYEIFNQKMLLSLTLQYAKNPLFIYQKGDNTSTYSTDNFTTTLSLGTILWNKIIAGYSFIYKNLDTSYSSGNRIPNFSKLSKDGDYLSSAFNIYYDSLNQNNYAQKGSVILFQVFSEKNLNNGKMFEGYVGKIATNMRLTEKISFGAGITSGQILHAEKAPLSQLFNIGGLRSDMLKRDYSFYGLPLSSVYTDNFFIGSLGLQYQLYPNIYLKMNYNLGTYDYRDNFVREKKMWQKLNHGYGVGIGWNTILGPMDFMVTNNVLKDKELLFQVHIGYVF